MNELKKKWLESTLTCGLNYTKKTTEVNADSNSVYRIQKIP